MRTSRTHLMRLRRLLGEEAENPTYTFSEPRVGYRMVEVDTMERIGEVSLPDALPAWLQDYPHLNNGIVHR